jgi:hypothetical protein
LNCPPQAFRGTIEAPQISTLALKAFIIYH